MRFAWRFMGVLAIVDVEVIFVEAVIQKIP